MSTDRSFSRVIGVRRAPITRGLVATAILAALAVGGCSSQPAAGSTAAAAAVTELPAGYTRLTRGVHPAARPENDRGPLDPAKHIANLSMVFKLSPAQLADREALKAALVDPKSPHFHQFLTTSEYAARFGAPRTNVERAKTWLASQGLEVHEDSPLGARVTFSGTVDALQSAFRTEMRNYEVAGKMHYAMRMAPAFPSDIGELVAQVTNTHDFYPKPMVRRAIKPPVETPEFESGSTIGFAVPDWANVYDVAPLYTTGVGGKPIDGTGVSIGIVGVAEISQSDVTAWRTTLGLAANPITMTLVPNTGTAQGGQEGAGLEATLDVEWSGGLAPSATVNYVFVGSEDQNVDDATYYAIDNNLTAVLSESWGGCEGYYTQAGYGPADQNVIDVYGSAANVLGISYVASSGDSGAEGCADGGLAGLYAVIPAAYPGVTSVGGTQFSKASLSGTPYFTAYSTSEAVWNESSKQGAASGGGGISVLFDRPSYQSGVPTCTPVGSLPIGGLNPANQRQVPDVAFTAAEGSNGTMADLMECTISKATQDCSPNGGAPKFNAAGGTSFAAPSFAGVVALMVQAAGGRLGNINPMLYTLASTTPAAFHDITLGTNEVSCTPGTDNGCPAGAKYGYAAATGYDCGAGLGSMDVYKAVTALAGQAATTTSLVISPTSTTEGTPVTFTATVAVPAPNAQNLGGVVTFAFESYDTMSQLDLSWTLGTGAITSGTTAGGMAVFTGAVPPGLVKPGMQSVELVAMYGGDATHLPSTSAMVPLAFGPISFSVSPMNPTVKQGATINFTSTGGVAPVRWYTGTDTTCNNTNPPTCATINENTGVFVAGPVNGTTMVQALDADGAEAEVTVTVSCVPATTCPTGFNCSVAPDGCGGTVACGTCTSPETCGGAGQNNVCGCAAATSCPSGDVCGAAPDGCGGMVMCGTCPTGQTCSSNQCVASSSSSSSSSSAASSSGAGGEGTGGEATSSSSSSGGGSPVVVKGCSCRTAGDPLETQGTPLAAFGMLALAGAMRSRKRRSAEAPSA
jgi:MYXO-CTERM domain-containing protein